MTRKTRRTLDSFGDITPGALIRLALDDLEKCHRDERYRLDMSDWHCGAAPGAGSVGSDFGWEERWQFDPQTDHPCEVCLAGAVMAQSLGADFTRDHSPDSIGGGGIESALEFLDSVRTGDLTGALLYLKCHWRVRVEIENLLEYGDSLSVLRSDESGVLAEELDPCWVAALRDLSRAFDRAGVTFDRLRAEVRAEQEQEQEDA